MIVAVCGLVTSFVLLYWYKQPKKLSSNIAPQEKKSSVDIAEGEYEKEPAIRVRQPCDYFLVLDVEATCVPGADFSWPNEIIEWPVVLLTWADRDEADGKAGQLQVVDEFKSFVRPTWKPKLSEFCTSLTGITQANVDSAPTFTNVLGDFKKFLSRNGLICPKSGRHLEKFVWATD
ncbi:hypothetical protein M422DRAFT_169077, partial [Sphaerobolus stellatus SS14]